MATERRAPEEVVCPVLLQGELVRGRERTIEEIIKEGRVWCLGIRCAWWALHFKGCGRRIR